MSDQTTQILSGMQPEPIGEVTVSCPGDGVLAGWYGQALQSEDAAAVSRHLSSCGYCRSRVGLLWRLDGEEGRAVLSEGLRAQAKQVGAGYRPRTSRFAPGWAAAAVVVLGLGLVLGLAWTGQQSPLREPAGGMQEAAARQLRSADLAAPTPEITAPGPGSVVPPGSLEVRWTPVEGSVHYELRFLDDAGGLLLQERLQDTAWRSAETLVLVPGARYYLRVSAFLADGRAANSRHVEVTVAEAGTESQAHEP